MDLIHILGANAVNPYTTENCIDKRDLGDYIGGRLYFVSPDSLYLDRVIADVKSPRFADKVLPLGFMNSAHGQIRSNVDLLCPISYDSDKGILKIAIADAISYNKIQLECGPKENNEMLRSTIREKDILKTVQGCRNVVSYRNHWFVTTPNNNQDLLAFVIRMDYLQGQNLNHLLNHHYNFTVQSAAKIIADIATAVYDIQREGVVHQDIKPGNIVYNPSSSDLGNATLIDFGVSCFYNKPSPFPTGTIAGTLNYMSPEQALGKIIPQTDIFALGILAYNLFTGRRPSLIHSGTENVAHYNHLAALARYSIISGDEQFGYDQRNIIMDNLRDFSEQRYNQRLPMSLLEVIEVAFDPDPALREKALAPLGNEALKLAIGEIRTEELPNILIERNADLSITKHSEDLTLNLLEGLGKTKPTFYFTTDLITVPHDTIRIPELVR